MYAGVYSSRVPELYAELTQSEMERERKKERGGSGGSERKGAS